MTYWLHFGPLCSLINLNNLNLLDNLDQQIHLVSYPNYIIKLNSTITSVCNMLWLQFSVIRLLISFDDLISKYTMLTTTYYIGYLNAIIIMSHNLLITYMA